jgi:hypothetical protein
MSKIKIALLTATLATGLSVWNGGGAAEAQVGTCTAITALPTTITAGGLYCLTSSFTYTNDGATAITVNHDAVVIDLNQNRLFWNGALGSKHPAVEITVGNINVVVRNGLISGFDSAIDTYASATIIEGMRISEAGIHVKSGADGAIIRNNFVRNSNIIISGNSARIVNNDIYGSDSVNTVSGVSISDGQNAFIVGNRIARSWLAIEFLGSGSGKYRDNLTMNIGKSFTNGGGTDAGNNN